MRFLVPQNVGARCFRLLAWPFQLFNGSSIIPTLLIPSSAQHQQEEVTLCVLAALRDIKNSISERFLVTRNDGALCFRLLAWPFQLFNGSSIIPTLLIPSSAQHQQGGGTLCVLAALRDIKISISERFLVTRNDGARCFRLLAWPFQLFNFSTNPQPPTFNSKPKTVHR